jgi:hypothetical protein
MSSSYIGKVDKARKYAEEPDRVNIHTFEASFLGNHNTYRVAYKDGDWSCECAFFCYPTGLQPYHGNAAHAGRDARRTGRRNGGRLAPSPILKIAIFCPR